VQYKLGPVGIVGGLLVFADLIVDIARIVLEWTPIRRILIMTDIGQAIDWGLQHWEKPGWLANPIVQILIIVIGFALIIWDTRRPARKQIDASDGPTGILHVVSSIETKLSAKVSAAWILISCCAMGLVFGIYLLSTAPAATPTQSPGLPVPPIVRIPA
jgi:hypothetical protein